MALDITKDESWGWLLIAVGVASIVWKPFDKLDGVLKGQTDRVLTFFLVILAIVVIMVALHGSPELKAIAVFWIVSP